MLGRIPLVDDRARLVGESGGIVGIALDEDSVAFSEAIYIFPGGGCGEGQLVGGNADDGS